MNTAACAAHTQRHAILSLAHTCISLSLLQRTGVHRCISVGTRQGFGIYNCEPFGKCFHESIGGIGIAEMLYCTSLVALVGAGEQVRLPHACSLASAFRCSTPQR